jgi:hypothetical protein
MNLGESQQPSPATAQKFSYKKAFVGGLVGAPIGAIIGILLSRSLGLGERLQQLNLSNTGSAAMLVKIDTKRLKGDGEVVIEPGKVGLFIYGEGDELSIFPDSQASGKARSVTLERKSIQAEANADDKDKITFSYKVE